MTDPARETPAPEHAGAAEEREAILEIIERYARMLSHGHGANAGQLLQQIVEEIQRRGPGGPTR